MKPGETEATFALDGLPAGAQVEVLGEDRKIEPADGKFKDAFRRLGRASLSDQVKQGSGLALDGREGSPGKSCLKKKKR